MGVVALLAAVPNLPSVGDRDGVSKRPTATATLTATPTPTSEPSAANFWIDPNGGTCTRQATAGGYVDAQACDSAVDAYNAATAGDVVNLKCGTYTDTALSNGDGSSQIDVVPKATGPHVVFRPEQDCTTLRLDGDLDIREASWMEFQDLLIGDATAHVGSVYMRTDATNIKLTRVHSFSFLIRGAEDITMADSEVGPNSSSLGQISFWSAGGVGDPARNVTLDNVWWHDIYSATTADHTDNIALDNVIGLTIRDSYFDGCENFCIIFGNDQLNGGAGARDILIENTRFDCCYDGWGSGNDEGPHAVTFNADDHTNTVFRFNSVNGCFVTSDGTGVDVRGSDFVIDSNIFSCNNELNCDDGVWRNNIAAIGSGCSGGTVAPTGWAGIPDGPGGSADYHLTAGATALGFGSSVAPPSVDFEGDTRGSPPDAGADERTP